MRQPTIEEYESMDRLRFPFLDPLNRAVRLAKELRRKDGIGGNPSKMQIRLAMKGNIRKMMEERFKKT